MDDDYFDYETTVDLERKVAFVTGANSGLGFETSKMLASKNATVIMACRNLEKGNEAKKRILDEYPEADIKVVYLDLSSKESIYNLLPFLKKKIDTIDFLVNNAGVMMPPFALVEGNMESQLGINFLSHFLLTYLLFPLIENSPEGRIVNLSSIAHRWGDVNWNAYNTPATYDRKKCYGQSKLACLIFAYELQRRLTAEQSHVKSFAAHPGASSTNLFQFVAPWQRPFMHIIERFFFQDATDGAMSTMRALLDPYLVPGSFIGPSGFRELKGDPVVVSSNPISKDPINGTKLWEWSEKQLGIKFDLEEMIR